MSAARQAGAANAAAPRATHIAAIHVLKARLRLTDEDYRALPDWVRDTYWWIRVPGTDHALYIPKPFEPNVLIPMTLVPGDTTR